MKKHFYYIILISLAFISCDDYLDVDPKGLVIPNTIEDFDLLLNGSERTINTTTDEYALFLTADDFTSEESDLGDLDNPNNTILNLYTWDKDLFNDQSEQNSWNLPYNNIYTYNLVIESIDGASPALTYTENDKKTIEAEAKVGRAYEYWLLVNTFAKQYSEATASESEGVPIITIPDLSKSVPERASVKAVYDFIIKDVEESIQYLPELAKNSIRPSKATGYGMLARFYLSMNNYEEALKNASLAISEKGEIGDYNVDLVSGYLSEQYIMRLYGYTRGFDAGKVSDNLLNSFDANDSRFNHLSSCSWVYDPAIGWQYICGGSYRNGYAHDVNHAVSVPEMYLIRAECNARLTNGTIEDVVTDLNALRSKRIPNYVNLTSADFATKSEALTFVLEERRRELFMIGMRLFDLKRLNLDPATAKTVTHTVNGVDYTLNPGDNNWVLPIPSQALNFAQGWTQNPRD
ncbi:RagB/SusD family nutrient uptake outer membrane protein [uncultured Wocania sp.]|uniref:RagB/SusD family nutrient uptake outer membrane protein n=1 Tax=uncultured Wocania sp. TaxID=2834404 RepID=UPI0030FA45A2